MRGRSEFVPVLLILQDNNKQGVFWSFLTSGSENNVQLRREPCFQTLDSVLMLVGDVCAVRHFLCYLFKLSGFLMDKCRNQLQTAECSGFAFCWSWPTDLVGCPRNIMIDAPSLQEEEGK